ncbi:ABC transporter ATP-binding protein [Cohnella sp. 56]|uniref:ABC transporter ATP-binding protein n=1 Tax=Cohnella sp. 56 TaxID=3113722 RepID=UPI0030EA5A91
MATILFNQVGKVYGKDKEPVVSGFNLEVKDQEFLVFVGPSGCGKSTVLRMLAGLESITEGEIYIGSKKVNHIPPRDRDISMVFQNYALYPNMTVYENIAFGLRLRKEPKHEIDTAVKRAARVLEIENYLYRKPRELSGGQRQRVALGRAIVRTPQAFLMDEPLSNLDAKLRVQMRAEIIRLQKSLGVTTIYVTHDQIEAMTMGDRIVILNRGLIQQAGTPEEVYNDPDNLFVAGFIGSPPINLIEGRVEELDGGLRFRTNRVDWPLSPALADIVRTHRLVDRSLVLAVRPENVYMPEEHAQEAGAGIDAVMEFDEFYGSDRYAHVRVDQKHRMTVRMSPSSRFESGAPLRIRLNEAKVMFFAAGTGVRLR